MTRLLPFVALTSLMLTGTALAVPNVVASTKPVHSLVAAVMAGVGEPGLIVKGSASPHTYSLRPSDAAALENADIVFWTGHGMELHRVAARHMYEWRSAPAKSRYVSEVARREEALSNPLRVNLFHCCA